MTCLGTAGRKWQPTQTELGENLKKKKKKFPSRGLYRATSFKRFIKGVYKKNPAAFNKRFSPLVLTFLEWREYWWGEGWSGVGLLTAGCDSAAEPAGSVGGPASCGRGPSPPAWRAETRGCCRTLGGPWRDPEVSCGSTEACLVSAHRGRVGETHFYFYFIFYLFYFFENAFLMKFLPQEKKKRFSGYYFSISQVTSQPTSLESRDIRAPAPRICSVGPRPLAAPWIPGRNAYSEQTFDTLLTSKFSQELPRGNMFRVKPLCPKLISNNV